MRQAPLRLALVLALAAGCSEPEQPVPEVPAIDECADVASWDAAWAEFEREVLEQINERRTEGADCESGGEFLTPSEPLTMHPALRCAARKHTLAMIAGDYVEHENPDGQTFQDRVALAEYEGEPLAQSIAAGQRDPERVVATLMSND
ncbi:MAG TPA: CAP domain-containing protein, partial [Enhygromyxa sp.]|nr:CAP domain-containing protein [Enhygromyxa sp.]